MRCFARTAFYSRRRYAGAGAHRAAKLVRRRAAGPSRRAQLRGRESGRRDGRRRAAAASRGAEVERAIIGAPRELRRRRLGRPAGAGAGRGAARVPRPLATQRATSWSPRWSPRPASRRGSPRWRSSRAGWRSPRDTIDLYLSMPHEEPNPVPVDELVRGRVALSVRRLRAGRRRHRDHAVQRARSSWRSRSSSRR